MSWYKYSITNLWSYLARSNVVLLYLDSLTTEAVMAYFKKHHCSGCGDFLSIDEPYCPKCGGRKVSNPECNWCGTDMGFDYSAKEYCPGCGRTMVAALETKPAGLIKSISWWFVRNNSQFVRMFVYIAVYEIGMSLLTR